VRPVVSRFASIPGVSVGFGDVYARAEHRHAIRLGQADKVQSDGFGDGSQRDVERRGLLATGRVGSSATVEVSRRPRRLETRRS
jgi:hypothetical protein